jgi:hypothetical protein
MKNTLIAAAAVLLVQYTAPPSGPSTEWTLGPRGYTGSETVDPNGDRHGSDNRGNTWSEKDGVLILNNGHGCTTRGGIRNCW